MNTDPHNTSSYPNNISCELVVADNLPSTQDVTTDKEHEERHRIYLTWLARKLEANQEVDKKSQKTEQPPWRGPQAAFCRNDSPSFRNETGFMLVRSKSYEYIDNRHCKVKVQ
jgi:hypothetical protein